jgi:hypothetical protein
MQLSYRLCTQQKPLPVGFTRIRISIPAPPHVGPCFKSPCLWALPEYGFPLQLHLMRALVSKALACGALPEYGLPLQLHLMQLHLMRALVSVKPANVPHYMQSATKVTCRIC